MSGLVDERMGGWVVGRIGGWMGEWVGEGCVRTKGWTTTEFCWFDGLVDECKVGWIHV